MAYYEVYIPNEAEPRIYTAVRKLRNLPEGTIIWRNMESERYPVQVCNGRAKVLRRKVATPSNNRLHMDAGDSPRQPSQSTLEGFTPAEADSTPAPRQ